MTHSFVPAVVLRWPRPGAGSEEPHRAVCWYAASKSVIYYWTQTIREGRLCHPTLSTKFVVFLYFLFSCFGKLFNPTGPWIFLRTCFAVLKVDGCQSPMKDFLSKRTPFFEIEVYHLMSVCSVYLFSTVWTNLDGSGVMDERIEGWRRDGRDVGANRMGETQRWVRQMEEGEVMNGWSDAH